METLYKRGIFSLDGFRRITFKDIEQEVHKLEADGKFTDECTQLKGLLNDSTSYVPTIVVLSEAFLLL